MYEKAKLNCWTSSRIIIYLIWIDILRVYYNYFREYVCMSLDKEIASKLYATSIGTGICMYV
jgi:hypothetical protein